MAYRIKYYGPTAEELWQGEFSAAQSLARKAVDSGAAVRVDIVDDTGHLLFHYPRVMRRA